MPDDDSETAWSPTVELTRRQVLKLGGSGAVAGGAAKVAYEYTGFGTVTGTNLTEQRLGRPAGRRLGPSSFSLRLPDGRVTFDEGVIERRNGTGESISSVPIADDYPDASDLEEPLAELATDLRDVEAGDFTFEFMGNERFFDRLKDARVRPFTVAALRGNRYRQPSRETIREFAGVDPSDAESLVSGLAAGFAERTGFDFSRYVTGTVQQYLLLGAAPLKESVREPTHFEALLDDDAGLYCYEYALRSIEAFHAVPPHRQSPPLFGAIVLDERHNHAYTGLASVIREDGQVRVPMTFLDYLYSTAFDNFRVERVFGDGIDAYDEYHRASSIRYRNPYGRR